MAKGKAEVAEVAVEESKGQGRAVVLPNGQKRIDFIRDEYYGKGTTRSEIRKAVNAMYDEGSDGVIPYQIVFAATKTGEKGNKATDPRNAPKPEKAEKADAK